MGNLAIIPARSGSKGLKDKNIKLLNDKPLIAYTIEAAVESAQFDVVHLSTDSDEYAEIGRSFGAECDFLRSVHNSRDIAQTCDVVSEVVAKYSELGCYFDTITILQPTSPLRNSQDIRNAFELYRSKNALAVVSVCKSDHPIDWFHRLSQKGSMEDFSSLNDSKRRQDSGVRYRVNGAMYIMQNKVASDMSKLYGERTYGYIMSRMSSIDIDDEFDFAIAECLMKETKLNRLLTI